MKVDSFVRFEKEADFRWAKLFPGTKYSVQFLNFWEIYLISTQLHSLEMPQLRE